MQLAHYSFGIQLAGIIPEEIGGLMLLSDLDLSQNNLTGIGAIRSAIGDYNL